MKDWTTGIRSTATSPITRKLMNEMLTPDFEAQIKKIINELNLKTFALGWFLGGLSVYLIHRFM